MPRRLAVSLVLLRTIIGWHFLYEGYYKLLAPAWTRGGTPLGAWTAGGYLAAATGPFAGAFQALAQTAGPWVDRAVPVLLVAIGLSLMLGLFTQTGAWTALGLLTLFYVAAIPTRGAPVPGAEGTYLIVNKTLVEWAAVLALALGRTGDLAGLDLLRRSRSSPRHARSTQPSTARADA